MRAALLVLAIIGVARGAAHADACSVDDIPTRVERLTGRIVDATTFSVSVAQRGDAFVATVEIGGGSREVSAPSCDEALDAAALVIGMAAPEPAPPEPPPPTREPPARAAIPMHAEVLSPESLPPGPARASRAGRTTWLSAGVDTGGEALASAGVDWRRTVAVYRVELRGKRSPELEVPPRSGATIWETSATGLACARASVVLACALATAGLTLGSGDNLDGARVAALPLLAIGARVEWDYPQDGFLAVRLAAEATVRATATHVDVNDMPVWTSRRFDGLASGSVVVRFP